MNFTHTELRDIIIGGVLSVACFVIIVTLT